MTTSAISCPEMTHRARPQGLERAVLLLGLAMTKWAREHADGRAMRAARRAPLAGLSDAERADLYRESTALREAALVQRVQWHAIG